MSAERRVAVVTGGNRGIGFAICRQLARAGFAVVLAARDPGKGEAAARALREENFEVQFHPLDVTDPRSIRTLAAQLERHYGRVDVLVNNAGILADPRGSYFLDSRPETYRATWETNVMGPLMVTQALLPLMQRRNYGRIVNMSSTLGQLEKMEGGTPAYRISKTALNAFTRIVAAETRGMHILVNSMHPGWVKTEMGSPDATRTAEDAADTAVWLATLPDDGPSGGFFRDRKPIPW